jgi:opacity protein-like surface antigen
MRIFLPLLILFFTSAMFSNLMAQGLATPLTIEGMSQRNIIGAREKSMGGVSVTTAIGVTALFGNPASLSNQSSLEFRIGGGLNFTKQKQEQEWRPEPYYYALTLMFENNYIGIDSGLQKPYDTIKPNWSRSTNQTYPSMIAVGSPLEIAGYKFSAGIGYAKAINLNHYFQNNNVLSPYIGTYRPAPIPRVKSGDTLRADWFQYIGKREGGIYQISPAIALNVYGGINIGLTGNIYTGSSDDCEEHHGRGRLALRSQQYFTMDSVYYNRVSEGTSKYKGFNGTIGITYGNSSLQIGAVLNTPLTLKRTWNRTVSFDTTGLNTVTNFSGSDKLNFPLNYTIGISLHPTRNWTIALDYYVNQYGETSYNVDTVSISAGMVSGNVLRVGTEYFATDWLALRCGYREAAQAFAPVGTALMDEPARGSVFSAGFGLEFGSIQFDFAYEYIRLKYADAWMSNTNYNSIYTNTISFETAYTF